MKILSKKGDIHINLPKIKVIFIPGNGGASVKSGWFPDVKKRLQKIKIEVIDEDFPDPIIARSSIWLPFITSLGANENTILIGHSSGAEAAMRYAENNKILGSVLVAPCISDLGMKSEKISGYYKKPWKWENIKKNQNFIIQFSSSDDPYIPIEEGRSVHKMLSSYYYEYSDQGHFGGNWDKIEFPEIAEEIKEKITNTTL